MFYALAFYCACILCIGSGGTTDHTFYKILVNDAQDLLRTKSSAIVLPVISPYWNLTLQLMLWSRAGAFSLKL